MLMLVLGDMDQRLPITEQTVMQVRTQLGTYLKFLLENLRRLKRGIPYCKLRVPTDLVINAILSCTLF